jgi:pimeloyl-ACP methyl ester carboxylesterase
LGFTVDISGPPSDVVVVFIHGSLDRSAGMSRLSRLAAVTHTTLRYDRRGYGRQRQHGGPFTVAGNVDDLEEILQGRTAVLVGHSYGGNIALAAAERLGEQIVGVSTYETPLAWSEWWPQNSAGGTALTLTDPSEAAEAFMIRMIGEGRWNQLPQKTREERREEGRALTGELSHLRIAAPWNGDNITCRVLCGHGTKGSQHHIDGTPRLAAMVRGDVVVIANAGHGAPISHPREFHQLLVQPHLVGNGTLMVTS